MPARRSRLLHPLRLTAVLVVLAVVAAAAVVASRPGMRGAATAAPVEPRPGITRLLAASGGAAGDRVEAAVPGVASQATGLLAGVATLGGPANPGRVRTLERLGLQVEPFEHLPLAIVAGTPAQLLGAVKSGAAIDVYPNERLQYFSTASNAGIGADRAQSTGLTGKGIGVAVVDSGVDATHPDLRDHVIRNFKVINGAYLGKPFDKLVPTQVVPFDDLPYNNADLTTGHGTHVAGIVAADGHTAPEHLGVAPDASIIGYACGDLFFLFSQLAAFDSILEHREEWNIRVVNNSWGSTFGMFDPGNPVNVATKALHDAGIVVVFAAGNTGDQMSLNPFAAAPWVIAVGSGSTGRTRSVFSSGGLQFDNAAPVAIPPNDHLRFEGDTLGLYHPSVSAPGEAITSSGTPTGLAIASPALPGGTATLSGTSMAAPHVAGVAALLLEARPDLTPDQVKQVLQVTAGPMEGEAGFWQSGYGWTDAAAAVELVRREDFSPSLLASLQSEADARVLSQRTYRVLTTDFWRLIAPPVSVRTYTESFWVYVPADTVALRFSVAYPTLPVVGLNPFDYGLTLKDGSGKVVARTVPSPLSGVSQAFVSLIPTISGTQVPAPQEVYDFRGPWRLDVEGTISVADPDLDLPIPAFIGNEVTVVVASLGAKTEGVPEEETPKGPPAPGPGGLPLPELPVPELPLSEPSLPVVDAPSLPLVCPAGSGFRLDPAAVLRGEDILSCRGRGSAGEP